MKVFLAAILFVGLCVLGLGFNIFFRKGGKFPETDISKNKDMKRLGITCPREDELREQGKKPSGCTGKYTSACEGCAFRGME